MDCRERECVVEIEADMSGVEGLESVLDEKPIKGILSNVCGWKLDGSYRGENGGEVLSVKVGGEMLMEKKSENEKRKSTSAKKPPKPPRPPRGLSLDAADQKLIKEIHELAMIKRARIERMKALKKLKAVKAASVPSAFNGSFFAMFFTVLFFMVLIFQGMSSGSRSTSFHGSPDSGLAHDSSRLVFVQDHSDLSSSPSRVTTSRSAIMDSENQVKMAIG